MTQNPINNSASSMDIDNINIDGNTISSTDTNGNIIIAPNGSGTVSVTAAMDIDNINIDGNTISSTDTNGNVIIAPDGSGTVSVTAAPVVPSTDRADSLGSATNSWDNVYADGITFDDGTNILDTYTEITSFTPTLAFGGASVGISYTDQEGSYSRIGNLVWVTINIALSNKGSSTGPCTIEGLPFTAVAVCSYPIRCSTVAFTGGRSYFIGISDGNSSNINVQEAGGSVSFLNVQNTGVHNGSQFFLSGIFRTAT